VFFVILEIVHVLLLNPFASSPFRPKLFVEEFFPISLCLSCFWIDFVQDAKLNLLKVTVVLFPNSVDLFIIAKFVPRLRFVKSGMQILIVMFVFLRVYKDIFVCLLECLFCLN